MNTTTKAAQWMSAILLAVAPLAHAAGDPSHNALVPKPREIRYGAGYMTLRNAAICVAPGAATEDRFAAGWLAEEAGKRTGARAAVREGNTCPGGILLRRSGPVDALPGVEEKPGPEGREAYTIHVSPAGAEVAGRSSAAVFYGAQTLAQMIESREENASLPESDARDWPALAYRGFMMDMSHTQLPTVEEIERQIDFLARWKTNQYYFYSEASIELKGFPLLMANARFTQEQVRRIISYARERHIDVVPNLELYGHMHDLFRIEQYANMGVFPHGGEFSRRDPHLRGLLSDWIAQIAALFPSPFMHIGFDETWTLEREAGAMGQKPEQLYLGQLREVVGMVEQHGKRAQAWADMLEKYPAMIPQVPRGLIAVPWHYMPGEIPSYPRVLAHFQKANVPTVVQGAVLNWDWCSPDYNRSLENIDALLAAGRGAGTIGFINSGWTDDTLNLMRESWPAMAYGSVAAWEAGAAGRTTFFDRYAAVLYPAKAAQDVAAALTAMARAQTMLQRGAGSGTVAAFWANPFGSARLKKAQANAEALRESRLAAEEAQVHLMAALRESDDRTLRTLLLGARLVDYAALKYIYAVEIAGFWQKASESRSHADVDGMLYRETSHQYHTRTSDLMDAISELRDQFREEWLAEYTPFRLRLALEKFDLEFQYWWKLQIRIRELTARYRNGQALPALETATAGGLDQ